MSQPENSHAGYTGQSDEILSLGFRTGLLTLLTLGIYRFWAKTRIRRYVWSSIQLDGSRFEYTGTGMEKFMGFLVAVVILAIYLGVIQTVLFFFGLTFFVEPETEAQAWAQIASINLTLLAVLPLIYFATYRVRRYKLARTRWRGIRFGMEKGAWGYAFRAMGYGLLTIVSLGLLLPLATFQLEKYMTDRSWFGDAQFVQEGTWQGLYPAMKHLLLAALMMVCGTLAISMGSGVLGALLLLPGMIWIFIGFAHYTVQSFAYLARHKRLSDDITFQARPKTTSIVLAYLAGALAVSVVTGIAFSLLAVIVGAGTMLSAQNGEITMPGFGEVAIGALGYLLILVGAGAAWLALVVQPIISHYVRTLGVNNVEGFNRIAQRVADTGADAEGFADALDIGGAI